MKAVLAQAFFSEVSRTFAVKKGCYSLQASIRDEFRPGTIGTPLFRERIPHNGDLDVHGTVRCHAVSYGPDSAFLNIVRKG